MRYDLSRAHTRKIAAAGAVYKLLKLLNLCRNMPIGRANDLVLGAIYEDSARVMVKPSHNNGGEFAHSSYLSSIQRPGARAGVGVVGNCSFFHMEVGAEARDFWLSLLVGKFNWLSGMQLMPTPLSR